MGYTTDLTTYKALDTRSQKMGDVIKRTGHKDKPAYHDGATSDLTVVSTFWYYDKEAGHYALYNTAENGCFAFSPKLNQVVRFEK